MVTQDFTAHTKELIDNLKGICTTYGLGNDGNEFKIITQVFLYKFMNDKFGFEVKELEPKLKKVFLGKADVRKVFKLTRAASVAGCFVTKGKIVRSSLINLVRNGEVVFEGQIANLKRFKDDVKEVAEGFECGITLSGFESLQEGDLIEAYEIEKIARKL